MLEIILGILGSGGFGSIVGLFGGFMNRKLDLKHKVLEFEDKDKERAFNLEYAKTEQANSLRITEVEAEGATEVAGYEAMAKSYNFAVPTSSDGLVDKLSKLIRPLLTIIFLVVTIAIFYELQKMIDALPSDKGLSSEEVLKVYIMTIEWILFQAGVCIGWWFAMRPGKAINFTGK